MYVPSADNFGAVTRGGELRFFLMDILDLASELSDSAEDL